MYIRRNGARWFFSLAILFAVSAVDAQQRDSTPQLNPVVVSASKVPQPAGALAQAVTVITGEDLRARGVTRVSDALSEVPGAAVVQSGSYGAVTSLFLRGGESRYTKVLIDGVAVNAPGGFFDFSHLTTDNIDRIEIVRGPASVLYGADAVTGVVQIFTRKGNRPRASAGGRGGTYRTIDVDGDVADASGPISYSLGAGHHSTKGILPFNNQYSNGTLSSALTLFQNDGGNANLTARYTAAEFHYPTDFAGQPVDTNSYRTQHRLTVGVDALKNLGPRAQARLLLGDNDVHDLTEDVANPVGASTPLHSRSRSIGYRRSAEARLGVFLPVDATVTVGTAYEQEHEHNSNASGSLGNPLNETDAFDATRHNVAYYTEILGNAVDRLAYTVSGRVDDNSDYARFATYRVGASVKLHPVVRLRGSIASAFNAPAFNQIRPTLFTTGSPNLQPEKTESAEVGFVLGPESGLLSFSANYFAQHFRNLIQYVNGNAPDFRGSYANLTGATANGYEAEVTFIPASPLRASASFNVVKPRVREISPAYEGTDQVGDELIRRPTHSANGIVSYTIDKGSLSMAATYVGRRADLDFAQFPSPRVTLPAYTRIDLSAERNVIRWGGSELSLNARVENVFNRHHEDVLHFEAPGRVVLLGARADANFR